MFRLSSLSARKKALSEPFWIRQGDEMTAGNFLYLLSEPFTRDTPLKFDPDVSKRGICYAMISSARRDHWCTTIPEETRHRRVRTSR
jgi:hypothetical protein